MFEVRFMANDKSLISFAVMSVEYGQNSKDYFDMIIPFILYSLDKYKKSYNNNPIGTKKIMNSLREEFGFVLHHNVVESILRRLTNPSYNYLYTENRNFYFTEKSIDVSDFSLKRLEAVNHQKEVINEFTKFIKAIPDFKFDESLLENKLVIYLNRYGFNVLSEPVSELVLEDKEDIYTYYIGKFISIMRLDNPHIFNYIKEIVKGAMLASALYVQSDVKNIKPDKDFENFSVCFDTPLLMHALGYSGDELREAVNELICTLTNLGVKMYCFRHNIEELEGILDAYIRHYNNNTLEYSYNFEYLMLTNVSASTAAQYKASLIRDLEERCHIQIHENPSSEKYDFPISIENAGLYLDEKILYKNPTRRENDIASVCNIYLLRKRSDFKRIENCQYIFVTTNLALCSVLKTYFRDIENRKDYPAIIDDTTLSSIVWLKTAKSSDAIPTLKLISDAVASQSLTDDFWNEFVKQVNRLKGKEKITDGEMYRLKYDAFTKKHVYEISLGDVNKISYENIKEALRLTKIQEHKDIITEKNKTEELYNESHLELIREKVVKYCKGISLWKLFYYFSKFGMLFTSVIVVAITLLLDSAYDNLLSSILNKSSIVFFLIALIQYVLQQFGSNKETQLKQYFKQKAYVILCNEISKNDSKYYDEVIDYIKLNTNFFKDLPI